MQQAILDYIKERDGAVSFVELCRNVPGFKGDGRLLVEELNIILWDGLSSEAVTAMQRLFDEHLLTANTTSPITYLMDGQMLDLPIATQTERPYRTLHWRPVVFGLSMHGDTDCICVEPQESDYFDDEETFKKQLP